MGTLTYRNCFLAFAALYLSTWSTSSWFITSREDPIWLSGKMSAVEIIISAIIVAIVISVSLLILFALAWATIKSFTGYSITLWEIILYLFIIGIVSFLALSFLLPLIFSVPLSLAGINLESGQSSDFESNISVMINVVVSTLVAAWSSRIFYQQISKKLATGEQQDDK